MTHNQTQGPLGYGPRGRILFDGDERRYELWEVKFLGFMKIRKLNSVLENIPDDDLVEDPEQVDDSKNSEVYAELVQVLDDTSLSLIIRDAKNDGRSAIKILRRHYLPKGKPRVITLYTELTSLVKKPTETVTDYIIRAETTQASLNNAGEAIRDSLLVAMVLKGLPREYQSFTTVVTQKEKSLSFSEFKVALRNFEDTARIQNQSASGTSSVMFTKASTEHSSKPKRWCRNCKMNNHDTEYCRRSNQNGSASKPKRWCEICRNSSHDTKFCRKLSKIRQLKLEDTENKESDNYHYQFKLDDVSQNNECATSTFLVDSGATVHVVNDKSKFVKFKENFNPSSHIIELADGTRCNNLALGQGDAKITLTDTTGCRRNLLLKDALFVPSFSQNIFSVLSATDNGAAVKFEKSSAELHSNGTTFDIHKEGKLYFLYSSYEAKVSKQTLMDWHVILGHCNTDDVIRLEKCANGMTITDKTKSDCEVCSLGKMTDSRSRKPDMSAKRPLDLVHIDLAGPVDPVSINGMKYAMICSDAYSGLIYVYFTKHKSDTPTAFKQYLCDMNPYGKIKSVRTDHGGEFISREISSILRDKGIKHEESAPYSPHQNGKAERPWRTLFAMARCLLLECGLPKTMWTYAVMAAAYIRNRCYSQKVGRTPFEVITGKKPNIANMKAFGTTCYALVQNPKKLDNRGEKGIFVGYDRTRSSPAYLVYFPDTQNVKRVRCVKFPNAIDLTQSQKNSGYAEIPIDDEILDLDKINPINPNQIHDQSSSETETEDQTSNSEESENPSGVSTDEKSKRNRTRPKFLDDFIVGDEVDEILNNTIHYCYTMIGLPTTYKEALSSDHANEWQEAMNEEMSTLGENDTFELTTLPPNRKAVGGKWVFTIKNGLKGEEKFKARYVAKGYSQIPDIDYQETFSPTARITSIRTLMQFALQNNLEVHQMDVKAAYLNAPIDVELYVEQPEGFEVKSKSGGKLVFKLKKSLYGLKQSGRNWNIKLHSHLIEQGLVQSQVDPCVYRMHSNGQLTIVVIWVDDLILATNVKSVMDNIKKHLNKSFKMKDLGQISWFLGIEFSLTDNSISMSQSQYIERLLNKFSMQDCKTKHTPCDVNLNKFCDEPAELADERLYREIVGSLIYIMTATRPDLCYIVTKLSQYMSQPSKNHMIAAKHVLRYLKATKDQKLIYYKSDEPFTLTGFCDADWGSSDDRKSTTGYGFMLSNTSLISWKSRKQPTIALSTCEAEYMAMGAATQEGLFLKALIKDLIGFEFDSFTLHCDNQGAIALGKNPVQHQRSKHIDIRYHFIRNEIQNGTVNMQYVPTAENWADMFTKPVARPKLQLFKPTIMGE